MQPKIKASKQTKELELITCSLAFETKQAPLPAKRNATEPVRRQSQGCPQKSKELVGSQEMGYMTEKRGALVSVSDFFPKTNSRRKRRHRKQEEEGIV